VRVPVPCGEKVTEIEQLAPGASVVPMQSSFTIVKSSVLAATLLKNSDWSPVLVAVIVCAALVVPTSCEANVRDVGANVTAAAATAGAAMAPTAISETASTGNNRRSRIGWTSSCRASPADLRGTRAPPGPAPVP
jgi:hypothetical protein